MARGLLLRAAMRSRLLSLPSLVTASSGCGLLSILLAGCYVAHATGLDASVERDGGERRDAPAVMPRDAGPDAPGAPSTPVSRWREATIELDGRWDRMFLARDGESRWLIVQPTDGGALHALELDPSSAPPQLRADIELQGTAGSALVAADGDGSRIVTLTHPPALRVHDRSGVPLSVADVATGPDPAHSTVALRDERIGLVTEASGGGLLAEVRDLAGGPPLSSTALERLRAAGVGEGSSLFAFFASEPEEPISHLFDLDEGGVTHREELPTWIRGPHSDGATFVGLAFAALALRHPDGRLEALQLPPPGIGTFWSESVAVGPLGPVVAQRSRDALWLSIDGGEWMAIGAGGLRIEWVFADQAERRVGAFFLDGEILKWAGLTSDG